MLILNPDDDLVVPENTFVSTSTGIFVPGHIIKEREAAEKRKMAVDLFAGCGGFSCGAMQAGMNVVAMVENDPLAVMTYCVNLCRYGDMEFHFLTPKDELRMEKALTKSLKLAEKSKDQLEFAFAGSGWIAGEPEIPGVKHIIVGDIHLLEGRQLLQWIGLKRGELACMFGSPPCQGFSRGNLKRHSEYPGNDLCLEFARLTVECLPHTIILENVPEFAVSPQLAKFVQILKQGGFEGVEAFELLLKQRPRAITGTVHKVKRREKKWRQNGID